jgi:hypothetical protein
MENWAAAYSVEMPVKHGPVTLLSVLQSSGRLKLAWRAIALSDIETARIRQ